MELHAPEWKFFMLYAHDLFVRISGPGGHFQTIGHCFALNNERMITRRFKGMFHSLKNAFAVMFDQGCFTVHQMFGTDDLAAISITDGLVAETHAQDRNFSREIPDEVNANTSVFRTSRAR